MRRFIIVCASGCGAGYLPVAPGTWGTAVGVALYFAVRHLSPASYAAFTVVFAIFAIWVASYAQEIYGETDPSRVVIDEIAGLLVTMAFHRPTLAVVAAGFFLFRIFDVVKPPPLRWVERRFEGGLGVVGDDLLAGLYANAALWIAEAGLSAWNVRW